MAERRKVRAGVAAGNTCMWAKQPCRAAAAGSMLLDAGLLSPAKVKFGHKLRFFSFERFLAKKAQLHSRNRVVLANRA